MPVVTTVVKRSPAACWKVLTDASLLPAWVPGLRRARVLATDAAGLATEIHFEFQTSLTYTLVYTYDAGALEMRWQPRVGKRDGVTGMARLAPHEHGALLTYELEHGASRAPADAAAVETLAAAFTQWMHDER